MPENQIFDTCRQRGKELPPISPDAKYDNEWNFGGGLDISTLPRFFHLRGNFKARQHELVQSHGNSGVN
jgi:hypothetical protein